jgi:DNA polymerase-3 subunit delta'
MTPILPINKIDKINLDNLFSDMPGALMISSKENYGVFDTFMSLVDKNSVDIEIIKPKLKDVEDNLKGSVGVEDIHYVQNIASRMHKKPQIVCFSKADSMTRSAQNAFLKLLEEPGNNTYFVLCTENINKMLPTIISRVQITRLHNITKQQSIDYVRSFGLTDEKRINQIVYLANGLPKLLKKLSVNDDFFDEMSSSFKSAMEMLASSSYKKIIALSKYKDDRDKAISLVDNILLILKNTIISKPEYSSIDKIEKLLVCRDKLVRGGNVRLNLISAML